ncbi:barttin isoform X2 [Protopterus annectens]|uniref:barttin isoform X2 n=1 Tax=Protopterus annectens TaxID=7888 RepID=UPI001CF9641F|nr:barttin isoform X2 [Protopterus annectens]
MPEEKSFRYGIIVLGLFLIMIGMFIMSIEKPHIYISFCTLGILMVAVGVTWSICQCYPKITFVPMAEAESEFLLSHKLLASSSATETELPRKNSSSTPYTSQEEANKYDKSLPSYDQLKNTVPFLGEAPGNLMVPVTLQQVYSMTEVQGSLQATAEVHCDSDESVDLNNHCSKNSLPNTACNHKGYRGSRLASFHEDEDSLSSDEMNSFHSACKAVHYADEGNAAMKQLYPDHHHYEDIALIDYLLLNGSCLSKSQNPVLLKDNQLNDAETDFSESINYSHSEPDIKQKTEKEKSIEAEMYYGINDNYEDSCTTGECE